MVVDTNDNPGHRSSNQASSGRTEKLWLARVGQQGACPRGRDAIRGDTMRGCCRLRHSLVALAILSSGSVAPFQNGYAQAVRRLTVGAKAIGLAYSPDGSHLAASDEQGRVTIWRTSNYQQVAQWRAHTDDANGIAYSPDGLLIATSGEDGVVSLWNARDYTRVRDYRGSESAVYRVTFNESGTLLASGERNGRVTIWGVGSDTAVAQYGVHSIANAVAFSRDGRQVISVGANHGLRNRPTFAVFTLSNRELTWHDPHVGDGLPSARNLYALTVAPGTSITAFAGRSRTITVRPGPEVLTPELRITGPQGAVTALAFSHDGTLLASGDSEHGVRVWLLASLVRSTGGAIPLFTNNTHTDAVYGVAFSPIEDKLASASLDGTVQVLDLGPVLDQTRHPRLVWQRFVRSVGTTRLQVPASDSARCTVATTPDSLFLSPRQGSRASGVARVAIKREIGILDRSALTGDIGVRSVHLACVAGGGPTGLLVERSGWYASIDTSQFALVDSIGALRSGMVLIRSTARALAPAMIDSLCDTTCRYRVVDAESVATSRLRLYQAREIARLDSVRQAGVRQRQELQQQLSRRLRAAGASRQQIESGLAGRVDIGMTATMVTAILGSPAQRSRRASGLGSIDVWQYESGTLELVNARVTAINLTR